MGKIRDMFATLKNEALEDFDEATDELLGYDEDEEEGEVEKVVEYEEDDEEPKPKKAKTPRELPKKGETKKAPEKAPKREPLSSEEAKMDALEYILSGNKVNDDLKKALRGGVISDSLRKLLEVLVDNDNFRELLLSQAEVKKPEPTPDEYDLDPVYTDKDGKVVADEVIEAMIKSGTKLEALGVTTKLERRSKKSGDIIGEASEEEFKKYFEDLYKSKK